MNKILGIGIAGDLAVGIVKLLKMKTVSHRMVSNLFNHSFH